MCFHFHSQGVCNKDCRYKATHVDLKPDTERNYNKFMNKTRREWERHHHDDDSDDDNDKSNKKHKQQQADDSA